MIAVTVYTSNTVKKIILYLFLVNINVKSSSILVFLITHWITWANTI